MEFVVAATDCTVQGAADPAKCNLQAEKVSGPHPGALASWQAWIASLCSLHLVAEGRKLKKNATMFTCETGEMAQQIKHTLLFI